MPTGVVARDPEIDRPRQRALIQAAGVIQRDLLQQVEQVVVPQPHPVPRIRRGNVAVFTPARAAEKAAGAGVFLDHRDLPAAARELVRGSEPGGLDQFRTFADGWRKPGMSVQIDGCPHLWNGGSSAEDGSWSRMRRLWSDNSLKPSPLRALVQFQNIFTVLAAARSGVSCVRPECIAAP